MQKEYTESLEECLELPFEQTEPMLGENLYWAIVDEMGLQDE